MYVKHDLIKPKSIEYREYQVSIAISALKQSTLVVLPTGMGKTVIALLVIAEKLKRNEGKVLFLAPTKPLVSQHASFLREFLLIDKEKIAQFTGEVSPLKRKLQWEKSLVIVSTPQVIENDLVSGKLDLSDVCLIVFDEAHRAVGEYSYVFVSKMYKKQREDRLVLGITASPGSEIEKILEICKNLGIKNIEIRTSYDPDVRPYVHDIDLIWKKVELPEDFRRIIELLEDALRDRLEALKEEGLVDTSSPSRIAKKKLIDAQTIIQKALKEGKEKYFNYASLQNEALKLYHAIELLKTQGVSAAKRFFEKIKEEAKSKGGSRASKNLMKDQRVLDAIARLNTIKVEHPKINVVVDVVKKQFEAKPDSRVIVFTHYRDTAIEVEKELNLHDIIRAKRFVGQATRGEEKGMSQKEQAEVIKKFREGIYNTLIATSVAEEGIDIPSTDMVVFYEPVPSEIRTIQRRGRTARKRAGKVVVLIAKNTPDEGYYWSSLRKEKRMRRELEYLRREIKKRMEKYGKVDLFSEQKKLTDFKDCEREEFMIVVDSRECRSQVVKELNEKGIRTKIKNLPVADYVISNRVAIERKSVDDFLESMISGKLFRQLAELKQNYPKPVLVIEGDDIFGRRNISHTSILGSLASIILDYGIPILNTKNHKETADLLTVMLKREQKEEKREVALRGDKRTMSIEERQRYILEGLPNVSAVLAKRLLKHFKTIRNIANAEEEDLFQVDGIGKVTAKEIVEIFTRPYTEP
ncbi:MAG: hypothetical protein DRN00_00190 [Thermoplasmata archaeon]|nr:MAG: hypothetical protein DRN03_00130 [Thermoplasmata archaeon]RLF40130.1 MAG: hypothetical protein DRN00_00190 [Thermoplasmata archaeon]